MDVVMWVYESWYTLKKVGPVIGCWYLLTCRLHGKHYVNVEKLVEPTNHQVLHVQYMYASLVSGSIVFGHFLKLYNYTKAWVQMYVLHDTVYEDIGY